MSRIKKQSIFLSLMLVLISLFFFGCDTDTPVERIYFNEEEIVLLVGESYTPEVSVDPSYATDRSYYLVSEDSSIISVNGYSITAVGEGNVKLHVVSSDNSLLEDVMTVTVRKDRLTIGSPRNFIYDSVSETFSFDSVENAVGYRLLINGNEISLGNSTSYSLAKYDELYGNAYDSVLIAQVKALAPTYSNALLDSAYTQVVRIYQSSAVAAANVRNGVLSFEQNIRADQYVIRLGDELLAQTADTTLSLTTLSEKYAGTHQTLSIVALAPTDRQSNVTYYDSKAYEIALNILDVANVSMSSSVLTWNYVTGAESYDIYINDSIVARSSRNQFDLTTLDNFDEITYSESDYTARIEPIMPENSTNLARTVKQGSTVSFNRFEMPNITTADNLISWTSEQNVDIYYYELKYNGETIVSTSTTANTLSLEDRPAGEYTLNIYAMGQMVVDVRYLSSPMATATITKQESASISISDYALNISSVIGDEYLVEFTTADGIEQEILSPVTDTISFDLSTYSFPVGENTITVTHLGNDQDIFDSAVASVSFVQLESVSDIDITGSVASVERSEINESADLVLKVSVGDETLEITNGTLPLNTTDDTLDEYIPAGRYTVEVYVLGNGSTTFSVGGKTAIATADREFEVLDTPEVSVSDHETMQIDFVEDTQSSAYNVYEKINDNFDLISTEYDNAYTFSMSAGVRELRFQSIGDGSEYLDSKLTDSYILHRLSTPVLTFDNTTNIISLTDENEGVVQVYEFMHNGVANDYAFDSTPFDEFVIGENQFSIKALAIDNTENTFYFNSDTANLAIDKIDNTTSFALNLSNQLVITPALQDREYSISLQFNFESGTSLTFVSQDGELVNENTRLPYEYLAGSYYVDLLNADFTPIIADMIEDFTVSVRFYPESDSLEAGSDASTDAQVRIMTPTTIARENQNITIDNILPTYTHIYYALLINDEYVLNLSASHIPDSETQKISVDINYIYDNVPSEYLKDINDIRVLSLNVDTNSDDLILTSRGNNLLVQKVNVNELTYSKDNNSADNSVIISFETSETSFDKYYILEIYNLEFGSKQNTVTIRYEDSNAQDGKISLRLDDYTLLGDIYVSYRVYTTGSNTTGVEAGEDTVYMFNSDLSNELKFSKVTSPQNIIVSNGIISWDSTGTNTVGYEIYKFADGTYSKINTNLITTTNYNLTSEEGGLALVVKAISATNGYTNSNLSELVSIFKLSTPAFSVETGNIVLSVSSEALDLFNTTACVVSVLNGDKEYQLNVNSGGVRVDADRSVIIIEPNQVLTYYGSGQLASEHLTIKLIVNYTDVNSVYYLDSNAIERDVYGLFAPLNLRKASSSSGDGETVDSISWTKNSMNVLDSTDVNYGYIFTLTVNGVVYYSTDTRLKYSTSSGAVSYNSVITTESIPFPIGYDENESGIIEFNEEFGAGDYTIAVLSVPRTLAGYDLLNSDYSQEYSFKIMSTPVINNIDGVVSWNTVTGATSYMIKIYDDTFTDPIYELEQTGTQFDFSSSVFDAYVGIYGISVQAISTDTNILNSTYSDIFRLYRMPVAEAVLVDDGALVISANQYYNKAQIEFVDTERNQIQTLTFSRDDDALSALDDLGIASWADLDSEQAGTLDQAHRAIVEISDSDVLNLIEGRAYSINIHLIGNSNNTLAIVSSKWENAISSLNTTKLYSTDDFEVDSGVLQYSVSPGYDTLALNYEFGNTALSDSEFWNDTIIYKLELNTDTIYAIDYDKFISAVESNILNETEDYVLESDMGDLYAYVRYPYSTGQGTTYLYFNVYRDNTIDLKNTNIFYYYPIQRSSDGSTFTYTSSLTFETIDIAQGGSFVIKASMLGGDSVQSGESSSAYLTSNAITSNTFIRYAVNEISTVDGLIQLKDQVSRDDSGVIDYPVYQLNISKVNSAESNVVYLYYNAMALDDVKSITGDEDGIYVEINYDTLQAITFDMSNCLDETGAYIFTSGAYNISVRTLAGLGTATGSLSSDYLLDSREPTTSYMIYKIGDTTPYVDNGMIKFSLATLQNNSKIYDYQIVLSDGMSEYIYEINRYSEGVSFDISGNTLIYELPALITIDDQEIDIRNGVDYTIKVRALAGDNANVINASFVKQGTQDRVLAFRKSEGISTNTGEQLRIEDGVLKWKVLDIDNYSNVYIEISYTDSTGQRLTISFSDPGVRVDGESGEYLYHYYRFTDERYTVNNTNTLTYIDSGVDYSIRLYVVGNNTAGTDQEIINSNFSNSIIMNRLPMPNDSELYTYNGILRWNSINGASEYIVTVYDDDTSYVFTTINTEIDFLNVQSDAGTSLPVGQYNVSIRAVGIEQIDSRLTVSSHTFTRLTAPTNIAVSTLDPNLIVWDKVDGAQGYFVEFLYVVDETSTSATYTITSADQNYIGAPSDMVGAYTVRVQAIGVENGYVFNSEFSEYSSSKDRPNPVGSISIDEENHRYVWSVSDDFTQGDRIRISYMFNAYVEQAGGIVLSSSTETVELFYTYQQSGTYYETEEGTFYYYTPSVMGRITNFTVQIVREGSIYSDSSTGATMDIQIFSLGAGSAENPYGLDSVEEFININYYPNAHYVLLASIDFTGNVDKLTTDGYFVSEFGGVLDGDGFALYGFGSMNVANMNSFALFQNLNGATINNLSIGEENSHIIVTNTFSQANNQPIYVSMLANIVDNSTISDIHLYNVSIILSGSGTLSGNLYIAGLISYTNATTLSGMTASVDLEFDNVFTGSSYVGGLVGQAVSTSLTSSDSVDNQITVNVVQTNTLHTLNYLGGAIGYLSGEDARTSGVYDTVVNATINDVYATNLGGIVGYSNRATIEGSTANGEITNSLLNTNSYIGAVVGRANSSIISANTVYLTFDITIQGSATTNIGAVAGRLTTSDGLDCQLINCQIAYPFVNQTVIEGSAIADIGLYGYSTQTNVIVSGCTTIE